MTNRPTAIVFAGDACVASGELARVALAAKEAAARQYREPVLIFDAVTGEQIDLDLRGSCEEVSRRHSVPVFAEAAAAAPRGPGRPKLGVVAREVTLLPRHWDWLATQPGGASVALRKLVEDATRANAAKDRVRASQNAAYRFMSVMAGNRVGFEEALRALFAGDAKRFDRLVHAWPEHIRDHAKKFAADALAREKSVA